MGGGYWNDPHSMQHLIFLNKSHGSTRNNSFWNVSYLRWNIIKLFACLCVCVCAFSQSNSSIGRNSLFSNQRRQSNLQRHKSFDSSVGWSPNNVYVYLWPFCHFVDSKFMHQFSFRLRITSSSSTLLQMVSLVHFWIYCTMRRRGRQIMEDRRGWGGERGGGAMGSQQKNERAERREKQEQKNGKKVLRRKRKEQSHYRALHSRKSVGNAQCNK